MGFLIVVVTLLVGFGLIVAPIIFIQVRKSFRDQKNFERGLKMVPMLIHLPPISEDTEVGGRDTRDVIEENISKAQVIYDIIATTAKKDFKSRFYGQRHFAFEVVGSNGFVNFYATVPVAIVDVVKQAIISAYPSARLEEVADHNIFSPVGKLNATVGGEFSLKEHFAYPIATYQDLKRDAMQSILNALSTLDKEDGVGIQILMRPASSHWRKTASGVASRKRKGKDSKKGSEQALWWVKQLGTAFFRPPEDKSGSGGSDKPDLSGLDQAILDSIDDKTRHPGFETLIRVVASSNISQKAHATLNNVVAAFALFDSQGKNGFKFTHAKDMERFVTAYILRFFPQQNNKNILNAVELATLFHFPDQKQIPTTQLERQGSRQVDGPRNISDDGILLGYNLFRGAKKPIRLSIEDRRRHMYVVGQTGTGKSIFLENLALQDMLAGRGFAFVDPHGETVERLMSMVPRERTEDIVYFCPSDMDYPLGLNFFEYHTAEQKDFLIQEAINMLYKLYDPQRQGIIGPRYEHWFRMAALTVMANPTGGTFIDIPKVFTDNKYAKELIAHVKDQIVLDFWNKEMAQTSDYHKSEILGWFVSKFGAFMANEMMRNIIGQSKSSFNLREIMDQKKILLVNLSKGRTGELNSKLLGMIFVMKFQAAAMSRTDTPEEKREDFCLYVDEFQNFSTDSFATILSEARKYRLNLIVANQFTTQLTDEIRDAVFGNVGSIVSLRVGADADADALSKKFQPIFEREDILRLPNFNTITQMLISGIPTQPFSMATIPPLGQPNEQLLVALKQLSAAKYGKPKAVVEKDIFERLQTKEDPAATLPNNPFGPSKAGPTSPFGAKPSAAGFGTGQSAKPMPGTGGSFLDNWLAKRQQKASISQPGSAYPKPRPMDGRYQPPFGASQPNPGQSVTATPQVTYSGQASASGPQGVSTPSRAPYSPAGPQDPIESVAASTTPSESIQQSANSSQPPGDIGSSLQADDTIPQINDSTPATGDTEVHVDLSPSGQAKPEDTIVIDQDGNFSSSQT
jgi:Type IV secretory system Conjugative DNA transfer